MAITDGSAAITAADNAQSEEALGELNESLGGLVDGIHEEAVQQAQNSQKINEQQADMVKLLATLCDNTDPANQPDEEDPLTSVGAFVDGLADGDDSKGLKQKGKLIDKPDQLMKLPECYSLPAILLWSKLDSIEKKMGKQEGDKNKKGGGIGNFFKGLLEGAAGIALLAIALIIFAGALVVFGVVEWGKALIGMISFTLFVLGAILLAKLVGKSLSDFVKLALGSALLAAGLLIFAFALIVCGMVSVAAIIKSIFIIGLFLVFTLATVVLGNMVTASIGQFIALAVGSALLSVALAIFALALMVCGILSIGDILKGIIVAGLMLVLMIAFAAVGTGIMAAIPALVLLSIGSIALSIGILVFALALREAMKVGQLLSTPEGLESAILIGLFFLGFMALAAIISLLSPLLLQFSVASILLSVGLMLFALAVDFSIKTLTVDKLASFIGMIPNMIAIFSGLAVVGLICIVATVTLAFFVAASALLLVGMLLFTAAIAIMFLTSKLLTTIDIGSTIGSIMQIMAGMVGVGIVSILATPLMAFFVAASALLLVGMLLFTLAAGAMFLTSKLLPTINIGSTIGSIMQIMTGMVGVGIVSILATPLMVFFVAASALLLIGMLLFAAAMGSLLLVSTIITKIGLKGIIVTLAGIAGILTGMIAIGAVSIVATPLMAFFMTASVLLMAGMLAFQTSLTAMLAINTLLSGLGIGGLIKMIVGIGGIMTAMIALGAVAALTVIPIGIFSLTAKSLATGILSIEQVIKAMEEIQKRMIPVFPPDASKPPAIKAIQDIFKACGDIDISPIVMLKITGLAISANILANVFRSSLVIFDAITKTQDTMKNLEDKGIKFETLMEPFKQIFQCVGDAAEGFQGMSKKAAQAMAIAIVPMTEAIDNLAHTIIYLADFALDPEMDVKMNGAKVMFGRMLVEFFGSGSDNPPPSTILGMMNSLEPVGKGTARAAEALLPVAEAISSITDTVIKAGEMQDPGPAISKLQQVVLFCSELNTFASTFSGEPQGKLAGLASKWVVGKATSVQQFQTATSSLNAMQPMVDSIKAVVNSIGDIADSSEQQNKLKGLMEFCLDLNDFACMFSGEPTGLAKVGSWLIGKRDSTTQIQDASKAIDAMNPFINSIRNLSQNLNNLQDVAISLSTLEQVFALASPDDLVSRGTKLKQFSSDLKDADTKLPNQNKLANFFEDLNNTLLKGDFSKLDQVAKGANAIATSISNMNAELTKLRQDNSQTMKDVSNMNKSNGIGGAISGAISSVGNIFGNKGSDASSGDNSGILQFIAENVEKIALNTSPEGASMFGIRK